MLLDHLTQAERHVALGESHVARQKQIVAALAMRGSDDGIARALLAQFEALLALHVAGRDRLRAELAGPAAGQAVVFAYGQGRRHAMDANVSPG